MRKIFNSILYLLLSLLFVEVIDYYKDYNELLNYKNYFIVDIKNGAIDSFSNGKIILEVEKEDNRIKYSIYLQRTTIFNIKYLKKIQYHGIISLANEGL